VTPPQIDQIEQVIPQLPPEVIPQVIPQLPPEVIPQVIPQLPPEVIPQVIPQLPPEVIPQVIPQLPPEVIPQVIPQLPPEVIPDPAPTSFIDYAPTDPIEETIQQITAPPPEDNEPQVRVDKAQTEVVDQSTPVAAPPPEPVDMSVEPAMALPRTDLGTGFVPSVDYEINDPIDEMVQDPVIDLDFGWDRGLADLPDGLKPPPPHEDNEPQVHVDNAQLEEYHDPYNDGYEDYIDEEPVDPVYEEPVYVPPEPVDSLPEIPGPGIELPETPFPPVMPPELPPPDPIYGREDPAAQTGSEAIFDRGYVQSNPAISNLIQRQRAAYGDALKRAVYKAPDRVQDDYVRPMSAAEFGSVPGRYTPPTGPRPHVDDPRFAQIHQNPELLPIAMNRGGSLNLNSSSLNRGIGQLPPMQQNDKLTQLFAQSFNPRR
jgi:hypothetical protein